MPMIYIDDCLRGTVELLECPSDKLKRRTYNMQGVSFNPEELTAEVKKLVPHLEGEYKVDPLRQAIGEKIIIISYFYLERFWVSNLTRTYNLLWDAITTIELLLTQIIKLVWCRTFFTAKCKCVVIKWKDACYALDGKIVITVWGGLEPITFWSLMRCSVSIELFVCHWLYYVACANIEIIARVRSIALIPVF